MLKARYAKYDYVLYQMGRAGFGVDASISPCSVGCGAFHLIKRSMEVWTNDRYSQAGSTAGTD